MSMLNCVRLEFTERRTAYNLEGRSHYSQKVIVKMTNTHNIRKSSLVLPCIWFIFPDAGPVGQQWPQALHQVLDCGPTKAIAACSNNFKEAAISIDLTTSPSLLWYSDSLKELASCFSLQALTCPPDRYFKVLIGDDFSEALTPLFQNFISTALSTFNKSLIPIHFIVTLLSSQRPKWYLFQQSKLKESDINGLKMLITFKNGRVFLPQSQSHSAVHFFFSS